MGVTAEGSLSSRALPQGIYDLYSFGMAVFLIWRFRLRAMLFYFFMKGQYYTDINLSGGAYRLPLVYLIGVLWESFEFKQVPSRYFSCGIFTSLVFGQGAVHTSGGSTWYMLFWREKKSVCPLGRHHGCFSHACSIRHHSFG